MRILGVAVGMTVALLAGPVRAEMKVVSQGPYSPARVEQFVVRRRALR